MYSSLEYREHSPCKKQKRLLIILHYTNGFVDKNFVFAKIPIPCFLNGVVIPLIRDCLYKPAFSNA